MNKIKFDELGLNELVLHAIQDLKFQYPSDIQEKSIPVALEDFDIIGQAQTGTGKTLAFGAPIICRMEKSTGKVQAIVLAPTRELAIQVAEELKRIAKYERIKILPIYGGQSIAIQISALKRGVDIVVGTPGRILDHIRKGTLKLANAKFLVIDEADEMLNMGFIEDIEDILSNLSEDRQTMLFSATMPRAIKILSKKYMKTNTKIIAIEKKSMTVAKTQQYYYEVNLKNKFESLCRILDVDAPKTCILFCKTKRGVDDLVVALQPRGYSVEGMHGDMKQSQRMNTLKKFKDGNLNYLIATDVAARGIDIEDVTHVINYDLPQDSESYVHRIGRTGRANKEGIAYSLITRGESSTKRRIENDTKSVITKKSIPTMLDIFAAKSETIIKSIKLTLAENLYDNFIPLGKILTSEFGADDVAASLIKTIFYSGVNNNYSDDSVSTEGNVRLFLSIGKMDEVMTSDIIAFLCETANINKNELFNIDILEKFSFIDVPKNLVDDILRNSSGHKLHKRRVNIEVAKARR
ncbi:DEAD/DEAH box helicase [Clostridium estertheticum]|uniref:DEAD/DEAH box helicase n=1 Tax=Clostridium estertheticum TaxID=238834 RepID=UPI0013E90984|nr:DEAD/DEAH box helicase [Clostridium estertheticum]MBZ9688208.1 DEAD/DEAH box helicase [Clostridium estertheticum]